MLLRRFIGAGYGPSAALSADVAEHRRAHVGAARFVLIPPILCRPAAEEPERTSAARWCHS